MADDDKASKTEDATPKKLEEAFKKGDMAKSQEIKSWIMLIAATAIVAMVSPWMSETLKNIFTQHITFMHEVSMEGQDLTNTLVQLLKSVFIILSVPFGIAFVAAIAGTIVQHKPVFTFEKMKMDIKKLSPLKGAKKIFSSHSLVEFSKTIFKFIIIASAITIIVWPERDVLIQMMTFNLEQVMDITYEMTVKILVAVVSIMTVIALLDFGFQKFQHHEKLKMTKQEVKDERKQVDGDPLIKSKIRQIRYERAQQRIAETVPQSNVVITNPTHYAVALKYEHGKTEVPILMAKGVDYLAQKIRELAKEHNIPIVENPPLARALYATVEFEEEIPTEHYKAVAEIISFILKLRK